MLNINAEMCYLSNVVFLDIGLFKDPDVDYAQLLAKSAHYTMQTDGITIAKGTLKEMKALKEKIVPHMDGFKTGYFDIPTLKFVTLERE